MNFSPLLNPLVCIPTGIIVILDFLSLPLYFRWTKLGEAKKVLSLLLFKPISTLICIYFMFTQFGAGFSVGVAYLLISPFVALLMFFVYLAQVIRLRKDPEVQKGKYIFNILFGLLIVISIAIPSITYLPIKDACAISNSAKIPLISQAMELYFDQNGKYPKRLEELVPFYISRLPSPSCNILSGTPRHFRARVCDGVEPLIFVNTIDFMGFDLYNFRDSHHSRISSFLDIPDPGYCP